MGVRDARRHEGAPEPGHAATEAANRAISAAHAYLGPRGIDTDHIVVLVRTKSRGRGDRTGGTAFSLPEAGDASAEHLASILIHHADAVLQASGKHVHFEVR